jgi:hypothetical protein
MCSLTDERLHLQTIFICDTSNFNLIDNNNNAIIYNESNIYTYLIDNEYELILLKEHEKLDKYENLLYSDLIKRDNTEFINKYFSLHSINHYMDTIHNIINNMLKYNNNTHTFKFIDMLFLNIEPRDNFNIVNVCIYTNKLKLLLDYINQNPDFDSKLEIIPEYDHVFEKYISNISLKMNIADIFRTMINKIKEDDVYIDLNPKNFFRELMKFLESKIKNKDDFVLLCNCINSLPDGEIR